MASLILLSPPPSAAAAASASTSSSSFLSPFSAEIIINHRCVLTRSIARRMAALSSPPPSASVGRRTGCRGGRTIIAPVSVSGACDSSEESVGHKGEALVDPNGVRLPLPPGLRSDFLPRHVAIVMDGNSRWAKARGLPTSAGHEAGYRAFRKVINLSASWGIRALTIFAFSTENWLRPKVEVDFLMALFETALKEDLQEFLRQGIRLHVIGDSWKLPKSLQKIIKTVEEATKHNTHLELMLAISYSGRGDIVQACRRVAIKVQDGNLEPADITESLVAEELETNCTGNFPYPDLLIRTSGELRLSNFLLWQSAYTELFFADALWPDFGETDYVKALLSFQRRQRHFGKRSFHT